jgi:uncharacterized protein YlxW (UPF0749 family)
MARLAEQIEEQKQHYYKEKDEPVRLEKANENIRKGVKHLQDEIKRLGLELDNYKSQYKREEDIKNNLTE